MTESKWLASSDPEQMLGWRSCSDRKLRLFACSCCRQVWEQLTDERSRRAVEVAERYADGLATEEERDAARAAAWDAWASWTADRDAARAAACTGAGAWDAAWAVSRAAAWAAWAAARDTAWATSWAAAGNAARAAARRTQVALLRCIVGNPFRPVRVVPSWLTWHDHTIPRLAEMIYEERAWDRMPILAYALEEAGCDNEDILQHCRGPGPHARGCWVVDLLTERE